MIRNSRLKDSILNEVPGKRNTIQKIGVWKTNSQGEDIVHRFKIASGMMANTKESESRATNIIKNWTAYSNVMGAPF